jgi:DNA mismatch endonuclease (patch repair protein)
MQGNRRRDTAPELRLRSELHRRGRRFRVDHPIRLAAMRARPDIVFTRQRVAVYVDGCFWHRCPIHGTEPKANSGYWKPKLDANVARDRRVTEALSRAGWRVLRIWTHVPTREAANVIDDALGAFDDGHATPGRRAAAGHRKR